MAIIPNIPPVETQTAQSGKTLHVLIRNREKVIYEGDALSLSSANKKGNFDVLGQHINFISIIRNYIKIQKMDKTFQEYKLRTGLMKVNGNRIEVFVGISDLPASNAAMAGSNAAMAGSNATSPDDLTNVRPARRDILKILGMKAGGKSPEKI